MPRSKLLEEVVEDEIVDANFLYEKIGNFFSLCDNFKRICRVCSLLFFKSRILKKKNTRAKALLYWCHLSGEVRAVKSGW